MSSKLQNNLYTQFLLRQFWKACFAAAGAYYFLKSHNLRSLEKKRCSCLLAYSYTCKYFTHKEYDSLKKINSHEIFVLFNVVSISMLLGSYGTSPSLEKHMLLLQANLQFSGGIDRNIHLKHIKGYNNFCILSWHLVQPHAVIIY